MDHHRTLSRHSGRPVSPRVGFSIALAIAIGAWWVGVSAVFVAPARANHQGHDGQVADDMPDMTGSGHSIPGAAFQVFLTHGNDLPGGGGMDPAQTDRALQTVIQALTLMLDHRTDYPRFDESVTKGALHRVIIEPTVVNREGKAFPFLVARTSRPGQVNLLISAASLKEQGYLGHPDTLVPVLAREFQWVVSKADTAPKSPPVTMARDLAKVPIRSSKEIRAMSGEERVDLMQQLFDSYLTTVDDHKSLEGQPHYEVGASTLVSPTQPDSTLKLYDIRVRDALQKIAREPWFWEHTPKAVRSLLNGKVWQVSFVKVDQRDWATRTRVVPEAQAVAVGASGRMIQPAKILVNTYRVAAPDDPFFADTNGLPMGALPADRLARVIALEIELNIVEKSMKGHVAEDERTAPQ